MTTTGPCQNCGTTCASRCSRCKTCYFCRKECQKEFWKAHKTFCKQVASPFRASHKSGSENANGAKKCLIVDGMGPVGPGWDYMLGSKQAILDQGMDVVVVDVTKGQKIPEQLAALLQSNIAAPNAMLLLGWGSGDAAIAFKLAESRLFCGGNFMVQGERIDHMGDWPTWFNFMWRSGSYFRTDHECFAAGTNKCHWWMEYENSSGAVTAGYNVKACMITNVAAADTLFGTTDDSTSYSLVPSMQGKKIGTGQVGIALGRYGEGSVSFFGDVNHETETLQIMAIIATKER